MKNRQTFKIGDKIVRFGKVYRIFKIKKKKNKDQEERVIFFRPYFKTANNQSLICSLPLASLGKTNIRKPISKKKLSRLLAKLSQKSTSRIPVDIRRAREKLTLNDPIINVQILKKLWQEKSSQEVNFTKSRSDVLRLAIKYLVEEVAFVSGICLLKAGQKIKTALARGKK